MRPLWARRARRVLRWCRWRVLRASAYVWRRLMVRTTVIAITGSVGKTTTKECLAAILSPRAPTLKSLNNHNDFWGVPRTILRMRPWHRTAVIEIGTAEPGSIRKSARLVRPDVAIVLVVAPTHTNVFRTLDDTAAEKAQILTAVPRRGLAILNGDDARVRRMADGCRCRVETFGRSAASDLWADQVSSRWPARLTLRAHTAGETQRVETRLVGEHWVNTVLAALLAARSQSVALAAAAETIAAMEPFTARMQPVRLPNGATVIRDEMNSSPDTWRAALEVLRQSSARRRVLVASDVSDSPKKPRVRYKELGDLAAEVADVALFIGGHAAFAVKRAVAKGMAPASVGGVMDVSTAAQRLASLLQDGDVVLLKGRATDHLSRALFAQFGVIGCWTTTCRKQIACDVCKELRPEFDLRAAVAGVSSGAPGARVRLRRSARWPWPPARARNASASRPNAPIEDRQRKRGRGSGRRTETMTQQLVEFVEQFAISSASNGGRAKGG